MTRAITVFLWGLVAARHGCALALGEECGDDSLATAPSFDLEFIEYDDDDMADDPAFMQGAVIRRNASTDVAVPSEQEEVMADDPAFVQGALLHHASPAGRGLAQMHTSEAYPQGSPLAPVNLSVEAEATQKPARVAGAVEPEVPDVLPHDSPRLKVVVEQEVAELEVQPELPKADQAPRPVLPEPVLDRPHVSSLTENGTAIANPSSAEVSLLATSASAAPIHTADISNASKATLSDDVKIDTILRRQYEYRVRDMVGGLTILTFLVMALCWALKKHCVRCKWRGRSSRDASTRQRVEKLRISSGAEIRSMFAMHAPDRPQPALPLRPGMLMRVQGRVVARPGCTMMAPLSGRACVMYSASSSQHQHGGVHQAPVAYHSSTSGFAIEVENLPDAVLDVKGEDVVLFDMEIGRFAQEEYFSEAPEAWRAFVMAHLLPSAGGGCRDKINHVDLSAKGLLEWRECALVVGATVTCVGEVSRERDGRLSLGPWSPPATPSASSSSSALVSRAVPWMTPDGDALGQRLMVSDDPALLDQAPPWQSLAQTLLK